MKLHAIKHDLKTALWCGPAALSAVTGKPTSHVVEAIRQSVNPAYRNKPVKGVSNEILRRAAELLGCDIICHFNYIMERRNASVDERLSRHRIGTWRPPTLAAFCRQHRELLRHEILIINITGHYVTVSGRSFIDNHTGKVVPLSEAPFRRARVQVAWIVRPGLKLDKVAPAPPKPADPNAKYRRESNELAKRYHISIEPHLPGEYWVYPPPSIEHIDPYADEHLAYDGWPDVRARVQRYAELVRAHDAFTSGKGSAEELAKVLAA